MASTTKPPGNSASPHPSQGLTYKDAGVDIDKANKLVTTPAYMLAGSISEAASGINECVSAVIEMT